jgi:cold shock CspA family protein
MDGVVLEQLAAVGQRVEMSAPLYRIARLKPLWLEIRAPLEVLSSAREGMTVTLPKYQAQGRIITILRSVNRDDQTVHIRAEITRGVEKLSPGQFVEAEIVSAQTAGSASRYSIPKAALVRHAGKAWLFVKNAKGFRPVEASVIQEQPDHAVVSAALSANEQVAVSGTVAIKAAWVGGAE